MGFKTKSSTAGKPFSPVFAEALGISEGDKLDEVSGKLTKLFDAKQAGKTTVQNGELETEHGTIKITLWGTSLPKNLQNKRINILATNKKFGEIEYKINEYDGAKGHVIEETLSIGNNADIEEVGGTDNGARQEAAAHGMERPAQQSRVEYDKQGFGLIESAESLASQHRIVHDIVHLTYAKKNLSPETLQAYVATIWIGLDRAGKIVIGQPTGTAPQSRQDARGDVPARQQGQDTRQTTAAPQSAYNPQNWAEAIIPAGPMYGKMLGEVGKPAILAMEKARLEKEETGQPPRFPEFAACVKQAAADLAFDKPADELDGDDIPF